MSRQVSLRLPEKLISQLDRRANRQRQTRSELIREILEQDLRGGGTPDHPYARVHDLVGSVSGGPPDMGARHRKYLVESIRERRG